MLECETRPCVRDLRLDDMRLEDIGNVPFHLLTCVPRRRGAEIAAHHVHAKALGHGMEQEWPLHAQNGFPARAQGAHWRADFIVETTLAQRRLELDSDRRVTSVT